ncbi:hypothetical protein BOTBODRAFT_475748 [Botryobasidium botryosum FD-172 SS1]|uniref:Uncharacterized protein n=1 Tax=Botryobasidium botryosum (strain FD-172 SS1) TaxID=930990 RepID=A0A067MVR5_BOTB1|nr:hypothetical protein BOTBODRAFT_475748 [Botryobasidium botryosum FD-172 SS1]
MAAGKGAWAVTMRGVSSVGDARALVFSPTPSWPPFPGKTPSAPASPAPPPIHLDDSDDDNARNPLFNDELDGLLRDSSDVEADNDAMSLHSNPALARSARAKRKGKKHHKDPLSVWGWHPFGRPTQPSSDHDVDVDGEPSAPSSTTIDADPTPLGDHASIQEAAARWEPAQSQDDLAREEEEQRLHEERRAIRKERRRVRKMRKELDAEAAAGFHVDSLHPLADDEFQGYPGSGHTAPPADEFGPFVRSDSSRLGGSHTSQATTHEEDDEDQEFADMGGDLYARRSQKSPRGSEGSASRSAASSDAHRRPYQQQLQPQPQLASSSPIKKKKSKSHTRGSSTSKSNATTSQSDSIRSPSPPSSSRPSPRIFTGESNDFPSTGFGIRRKDNGIASMGVALARTKD